MIHEMINQAAYMAHGYCLLWKPWLIAAHAGSDFVISAAYFAIPLAIRLFVKRRKDLELRHLTLMFAAFIFFCGLTHVIQCVPLWWPIYETQAYVKVATAAVSVTTAIVIFSLIPKALAIPSPRQLQMVNARLTAEIAAHRETLAELQDAKDELDPRVAERTKELKQSNARFEALVMASAEIVWTANTDGDIVEDSPSWRSFTGQSFSEWQGIGWMDAVHPDDRSSTLEAWQHAVRTKDMYSVEYRVRHHQFGWRWMAAKGVPVVSINGDIREWIGMNIDIDDQRRSEERMQFIIDEFSHRTKNLLAVIHAMSRQAAKHGNTSGAPLHEHVRAQLLPFIDADNPRVTVSGPPVMLTPEGTQALGFAFHELTTNAVKHGALTLVGGDIEIAWQVKSAGDRQIFSLRWSERCAGTPRRANGAGFGTMILQRVVPSSLSGVSRYLFEGESIIWEIETPLEQVVSATALPLRPKAPEPALDHVSTSA